MLHKCLYLAGTICLFVEIMKKVPLSKQSNKTFISSGSAVKYYAALLGSPRTFEVGASPFVKN